MGSALSAATTAASLLALAQLVEPGRWSVVAPLAVFGLAGVIAGTRAATRSLWAPSLVGLVVAVLGLAVRYGAVPGRVQVLPDVAAIRRAWALGAEGMVLVRDSTVPMASTRAAELLVVAGALAVLLVVDALALGVGMPALAALPLAAMWMPAVFLGYPASGSALFWTGTGYLLLLALGAAPPGATTDRARRSGIVVASTVAAVVAALVLGPIVAAFPAWAAISLPTFGSGPLGPLHLSDDLDLRESLGARSGQVVLRYTVDPVDQATPASEAADAATTETPAPTPGASPSSGSDPSSGALFPPNARTVGVLRAMTLSSFDGREWHRTESDQLVGFGADTLLGSAPQDAATGGEPTLLDVSLVVGGMRETRLPISTFPRTLQIDGPWQYDENRDEVVGGRPTTDGMTYSMRVQVPNLTADELASASVGDPPGDDDYLAVPVSGHSADVRTLAAEITADSTSPYEQAMKLQAFFRSTANFEYDTRVAPARSDDAVWDFIQSRRGYCVQFASAMAVMARTLGIPSRVAVGFLPGDLAKDDTGEYVVTGHQAHAWPELYFEGIGWVRFEPTPAVQSGAPPIWSDPAQGGSSAVGPSLDDLIHGGSGVTPGATATPTQAPGTGGRGDDAAGWAAVAGGALGALLLLGGGAWYAVTRSRRAATLTSEDAWRGLRRALARREVTWSDATTPRQAVLAVRDHLVERTGGDLEPDAREALVHLASAVERGRYAPRPVAPPSAQLRSWIDEVLAGLEARLAAARVNDRSGRAAGPTVPRSGT